MSCSSKNFLYASLIGLLLSACTPKDEPKTVDYYLKHDAELHKVLNGCKNNPGKYKDDGDCINARQALTVKQATDPVKAVPY